MAIVIVSGAPGCRHEELARTIARRLEWGLATESRLVDAIRAEFGDAAIPDKAWPPLFTSVLVRQAAREHVVVACDGAEALFRNFRGVLRVQVTAPEAVRAGNLMLDKRLDRPAASTLLKQLKRDSAAARKRKFGRSKSSHDDFDLILAGGRFTVEQMADVLESAIRSQGLPDEGLLSGAAEAQTQFQVRLQLAKYGIAPPDRVPLEQKAFGHPAEEIFARVLDFYGIAWEYEPRSFALQWDKDGKVLEAFTPDFYLPEADLYVELTTMKQAHVTRKNRKVRLLRAIYPHVNIQVFYQKDMQDLVMKYGIAEPVAQ